MKRKWILLLLLLFPIHVFAYSHEIYITGEPIGIEMHAKGVYVIDFYPVNHKKIGEKSGIKIGDMIVAINDKKISNIDELNREIKAPGKYLVKVEEI